MRKKCTHNNIQKDSLEVKNMICEFKTQWINTLNTTENK